MENHFKGFIVEYIKRNRNTEADELVKDTARNMPLPTDVFFRVMEDALMKTFESEPRLINIIEGEDWQAPIMMYLHLYYESDNTNGHTRMQQRAKYYQKIDNDLYKTFVSGPVLRCVSKAEGQELLSEVHAGVCGGHIGA
jgi:hypothetical protein